MKTSHNRRSFLKVTALAGGGMMLGFSWLAGCKPKSFDPGAGELELPEEWYELNGFLKIGENGVVTIMSPNPEIGQNVKTSMPMIVAEELDCDWSKVIVEQAPLNTAIFTRQLAGGSQSIRQGWKSLRMAGASARHMLRQAAADAWQVPIEEVTTAEGMLIHSPANGQPADASRKAHYGEFASAAAKVAVPEEVALKSNSEFSIVGSSRRNVDAKKIVTGQALFGLDYRAEGMLYATLVHPPAFGMRLKSFDASAAKAMPGIKDVFEIQTLDPEAEYTLGAFDMNAFPHVVAVVGESTWQVMQASKAVRIEWETSPDTELRMDMFGREVLQKRPAGLESSEGHNELMERAAKGPVKIERHDGDVDAAFAKAHTIIERSYTAPFLAHNTMEPMNFFADVKADHALLVGPIQTPEFMEKSVSNRLGIPVEKIDLHMTRMGGGFGRRLYGHFVVEAALISQRMQAPVKLVYSREDDMRNGVYRPAYHATYKAGLDAEGNLIALELRAGGIPESPIFANRFPAGAVENYRAASWTLDSNITTGAWRAPRSNFIAGAEQAFLDEIAEAAGKDPIDFRLELLEKASQNPVGEKNDYDAGRFAEVLRQAKAKASPLPSGQARGVSAYFCHDSYVANVLDLRMERGKPVIEKVLAVVDCGIVVNPDAAINMVEGGTIDGIGHALYSGLNFANGEPKEKNFDTYRLIRHSEAPRNIEVHFVDNGIDPTGLGEPPFPPVIGAVANALYRATGTRYYKQPFLADQALLG